MANGDVPNLGSRLREARRTAGYLNRESVVEQLGDGFSAGSLHRWENGEVAAPFDKVVQLADLYGVSLDWLAGRTGCQLGHTLDHGKVVVDSDGLDRLEGLPKGAEIPEDILGPRFHCVWTIPQRFLALNADAAQPIQARLRAQVNARLGRQGKKT